MPKKKWASSFRFILLLIPSFHLLHYQRRSDRSLRCNCRSIHCNVRSRLFPYFLYIVSLI